MNTRPCRMVTSRYPAEGSVVMAKIDAIHSNNITISMLEYKNLKGRLLLSHDATCVDISRLGRVEPLKGFIADKREQYFLLTRSSVSLRNDSLVKTEHKPFLTKKK
ncbi:hypothetical protein DY000_02027824 [Brassica cretica]|uniref:S1 motif domain-containing protein n=1 Tax=Brassica cretica TaxID=69181 RepID=A0ABQ7E651_BRACR|nr:hypothetical protein DY000_02027824 [Brassica cretica]